MSKVMNANKKLFYDNTRDSHLTELRVSTLMRKMPSESTLHRSTHSSSKVQKEAHAVS